MQIIHAARLRTDYYQI